MANGAAAVNGSAIVSLAAAHIGQTYVLGQLVPKDDPNWSGPWDCAEFCSWLVFQTTGKLYGCAPNSSKPATADAYTGYWRDDAKALGTIVTIDVARRTPGAFLLRVPTTIGHVVVSDGQGGTIEAMGRAFGVRRGAVSGRVWDFGILVPGISYGAVQAAAGQTEEPPPSTQVVILRRAATMVEDARVEALQRALAAAGVDPGPFDGLFGSLTERAVFAYQSAHGLTVDGEVGPETGRALALTYWSPGDTVPVYARPAQVLPLNPPASDWPEETRSVIPSVDFNAISGEYVNLWNTMLIRPDKVGEVKTTVSTIVSGRPRYDAVAAKFSGLPWYVIGILHSMECSCNFKAHLHNGDPLTARTVHAPKNRPPSWDPAWPWENSAEDAVRVDGLDKTQNWTLPRILFMFEQYNGFGPRRRFGKATAYLWSYSNHYVRGKYIGDGQWDPEAPSKQPGAAVLLKQLVVTGAINEPTAA